MEPWQQKAETWRKSWVAERERLRQMEKVFWQLKASESDFYCRVVALENFLIKEGYRKLNNTTWTKEPLVHSDDL